jgi:hypothetical protein
MIGNKPIIKTQEETKNLQEVTDAGNVTANPIIFENPADPTRKILVSPIKLVIVNTEDDNSTVIYSDIIKTKGVTFNREFENTINTRNAIPIANDAYEHIRPNKSGTYAMLDDTQILTAGANITIVDNVISATGDGGGGSFVKLIVGDSVESAAVTGTIAEVIAKTYTIPAGAFSATLNPRFTFYAQKGVSTAGTFTTSIYLSNTNDFATGILTGFYTTTSGIIRGVSIERITQRFIGANLFSKVSVQNQVSDNGLTSNSGITFAIDQSQIIYVWITLQNNNVNDSTSIAIVKITD